MATATLINQEIEEGKRLIDALNAAGLSVNSALWLYSSERETGQLMLTSPLCDKKGILHTYSDPKSFWQWTLTPNPSPRTGEGSRSLCQIDLDWLYKEIMTVFPQVDPELKMDWTGLVAVSPNPELIKALRQLQTEGNFKLSGRRMTNNLLSNRMWVDDAYIYQIA